MLVDTHCHLSKNDYNNLDNLIKNFDGLLITAGVDDKTNLEVMELVNKYDNLYGVIGIHPSEVDKITEESFKIIEDNLNNKKIIGIGEIGLDYHYGKDNIDLQKEIFIKQLELAKKYHKTVVVHSRDSILDTYNILVQYKDVKKVIHCFSSSLEMAKEFIKINCMLGIGGTLTFKNNRKLVEVVENIDLKYFLLETDSPWLSPEPFRGQKNVPNNTKIVAEKISEIKKINIEKVLEITGQNATYQFDLKDKI